MKHYFSTDDFGLRSLKHKQGVVRSTLCLRPQESMNRSVTFILNSTLIVIPYHNAMMSLTLPNIYLTFVHADFNAVRPKSIEIGSLWRTSVSLTHHHAAYWQSRRC